MLKLSRKVEYALIALLHMDRQRGNPLVSAKEIAETYHIPAELLGKVMQTLSRAGFVESVKGARGGYQLKRSIDELSVGKVLEAVEGPILIAPCCDGSDSCRQHDTCNIRGPIQRIQEDVRGYIHGLPLSAFRSTSDAQIQLGAMP